MSSPASRQQPETRFTDDLAAELRAALDRLGSERVLVITTPSRRFLGRVKAALGELPMELFDGARVHVPVEVVAEAEDALRSSEADTVLTVGGGAATGLGKVLRLAHPVHFVAVPTTYAASEQTTIHGVRDGGEKKTGRDPKARPDVAIYDPSLTSEMPRALTVQSLLNALAHPIGALGEVPDDLELVRAAEEAIGETMFALEQLAHAPHSRRGREVAFRAAARSGAILERGVLGFHHRMAHLVGGTFDLDHAAVHSILLPHTVHELAVSRPVLYAEIADAAGVEDLPAALFELLKVSGAPTALRELEVERDALEQAIASRDDVPGDVLRRAFQGGRPSSRIRLEAWRGLERPVRVSGPPLAEASRVVVGLHGRGANAFDFTKRLLEITGDDPSVAIVAPQAVGNQWYSKSYSASATEHGEELAGALEAIEDLVAKVAQEVPAEHIFLAGFSQGACLAAEYVARGERVFGGLFALSGARIGPPAEQPVPPAHFEGMPVLLGGSSGDRWVPPGDIEETAETFRDAGASVEVLTASGDAHRITALQRIRARELLFGRSLREGPSGFGNHQHSEALPGALPPRQNSPRRPRYGLFAEQVNATGFTAPREENRRVWLYRVRPSAQHTPMCPLEHPTFGPIDPHAAPEPNLAGWGPLPLPTEPTDFVDGLCTFGGAGSPALRRGFAVHLYACNRSMEDRAFYDADGELLLLPQEGRISLQTELGVLDLEPGKIAIIPRGAKVAVHLRDPAARGWIGETYGRSFRLPERGPAGANGLTDPRHFRAPRAFHEDRLVPGFRLAIKHGGRLYEAVQDHSPFDVVAWHGNDVPYVYDLLDFSPVSNALFDHGDPSLFTVLTSPLDEQGAHGLDLVFFPPRWDATEGTFRPPYFHRNAVTELNGVIREPAGPKSPFRPGTTFVTPPMTAHGVRADVIERARAQSDERANRPRRSTEASMWWQFESALPLVLSDWAREASHRRGDWPEVWGAYRSHYPSD